MFHEIGGEMAERMKYLEEIDRIDRSNSTPRLKRLRQIPPETGRFIALMASLCPDGEFVEIGTSAGYSTMWLSLAAKLRNIKIKTYEILPEKISIAKETFRLARIENYVDLIEGDFLYKGNSLNNISFCFLDAEKEIYEGCFDIIYPRLIKGGILVSDNALNHYSEIKPMIDKAQNIPDLDCLTIPIGKGEFVCRKS